MQIVIEIPKMAYNLLKSDATIDWLDAENILNRIVDGIVLPEGHGDLVDRNEIEYYTDCNGCYRSELGYCCDCMEEKTIAYIDDISNLDVLVPAEKG